ncbi:TIGR04282 family arsenosugar biosynthesis glycosyltransferase [Companilactobacillus zhongbaensis]|uniref:TIGR04282 family arsenosugar biosynthesis glycosyltransferase n=1 Tax=Companilactobacillus zhongbaensis TaxID=2486009 RepID=UPI000F78FFB0|nr:TIGR04282 family arsenosugar biosynthesis glycosyltransferase [Companilactobacillus zhongbaensis]
MDKAYIIFTKIPNPGFVKTRLTPDYSKQQAADIQSKMLNHLLKITHGLEDVTIFLAYYSEDQAQSEKFLLKLPSKINVFQQSNGSIGNKMSNAIDHVKTLGFKKIVLTGSDIPRLNVETLQNAFSQLDKSDIVLGPTWDGGYYLFGMKNRIDQTQFLSVPIRWSTDTVFAATLNLAKRNQVSAVAIESLSDVDFSADWQRESKYVE